MTVSQRKTDYSRKKNNGLDKRNISIQYQNMLLSIKKIPKLVIKSLFSSCNLSSQPIKIIQITCPTASDGTQKNVVYFAEVIHNLKSL